MPRAPAKYGKATRKKKGAPRQKRYTLTGGVSDKRLAKVNPQKVILRSNPINTWTFKRSKVYLNQVYTTNAGGTFSSAYRVSLNDFPQFSEFTGLFDQYRILATKVIIKLVNGNVDNINDVTPFQFPCWYYVKDTDDDTPLLTIDDMSQHPDMKTIQFGNKAMTQKSMFIPCGVLKEVTGINQVGTYTVPVQSPWIDTADSSVEHGAIKWIMKGQPSSNYTFDVIYEAVLQFKHLR